MHRPDHTTTASTRPADRIRTTTIRAAGTAGTAGPPSQAVPS
ncbi:hypothetical protein AB0M46_43735 [Dactylosporangium sp. NPDC051485]